MSIPAERKDLHLMRAMFSTIAPHYDFFTRIFSYGMDRRWKRRGVQMARLPDQAVVLDLASGTGDFTQLVAESCPHTRSIAVDLTEGMLRLARVRGIRDAVCADATILPFPEHTFDCVFIGYGLRNFPDLNTTIREIERVTRPGGLLVTLDFFLPANPVLRQVYLGWLYLQGGFFGLLLHGRPRIYTYIPDSLRAFVSMQDFAERLQRFGYDSVKAHGFLFGGIGLHCAAKKENSARAAAP